MIYISTQGDSRVGKRHISDPRINAQRAASGEQLSVEYSIIMSALEQRTKKQRAAPPQRDKRNAGEDTLDDNTEDEDDATTPALAVELRTDGYRVAAMLQPAPLSVEAKRARGQQKPPQKPPPAFGEVRPYGTAAATALLSAIDKRVLPRALAPGLAGVVRLRILDRRPGGGGPREVACRVGDSEAAAAAPAPPRRIGAPAPRRSLADALDDDGGDDSDDSDDAAEEIVVAEPPRPEVVVEVDEEEEVAEEASVAALRARLSCLVDVARAHGFAS